MLTEYSYDKPSGSIMRVKWQYEALQQHGFKKISIIDNGPGIKEEIKDSIFFPMITGKDKGTGLGLSITQGIISQHKGNITFEITPQHLTIYAPDCYDKLGTYAQMNPPIRDKSHYDRLWYGVRNNFNDTIGSDHAPHLKENKDKVYPDTPSGMPGVQTIFPVMLDHVNSGKLSLEQLINLMCENPCRIFGIKNKGYIKEGFDADLTIADMNKEVVIKDEMIASKCGWTPFNNYKVKGFPVGTIVNGNLVMSDGKVVLESKGQPLKF